MAFFLLLVYLSLVYIRPGDWIAALQGLRVLQLALISAAFSLALWFGITGRAVARVPHNRMMLGFFAAVLASNAAHAYLGGITSALAMFSVNLITYFLIVNVVTSRWRVQVTFGLLVALTTLLAIQGIHQAQTGVGWAGQGLSFGGRITWVGIFNDPNDLALAFVIMVPVVLGYLFGPSFIGLKWVHVILLGILTYGIYLTNSRGGVLALMAAVGFFFIKRSKHRVLGGVVGGAAAAFCFLFGPSRLGMLSASEDSAAGRLDAWYYGFQLLKHSPLFGAGYNMFTDDYPLTAHNSFVLALAELGLVGFFFWVGLLYTTYKGLSLVQRHPRLGSYAYGLQASLIGFAAAAFFLSRTYIMLPYLLFALSAALVNAARLQTPEFEFRFSRADVWRVVQACGGILALLQIAMKTWL